jgi:hypothetical protein
MTLRRPSLLLGQRVANGGDAILIRRETGGSLSGNLLRSNPDCKFASVPLDEIHVDPGGLRDERCHTGGARPVISNLAISDMDGRHRCVTSIA